MLCHVLICIDANHPLLDCLWHVLVLARRDSKAFAVNIRGKQEIISIDHLEPAFYLSDDPVVTHFR